MAGDDAVTDQEYLGYISEITGVPVRFERGEYFRDMYLTNNSKRESIVGKCRIAWREGMEQTIAAHFPDLIKTR
jgi:hypothetical protein